MTTSINSCPSRPSYERNKDAKAERHGRHFTLKMAVNAKTPRGKGARDREMTRKKPVYLTPPTGDGTQQPKPLCFALVQLLFLGSPNR